MIKLLHVVLSSTSGRVVRYWRDVIDGYPLVKKYSIMKKSNLRKRMSHHDHHDASSESSSDRCPPNPCLKKCECCEKACSDLGQRYEVSSISCDSSSSSSSDCENAFDELCKSERMDYCPRLDEKGKECHDSSSGSDECHEKRSKKKNWSKELCGDDCHPYSSSSSSSESECPDCRVWQPCVACSKKKKYYYEKEKLSI